MMQYGNRADRKAAAFADSDYYMEAGALQRKGKQKLSGIRALILGVVLTLELMLMGGMLLNIDFRSADRIALILSFAVLYFGVVAGLTDK